MLADLVSLLGCWFCTRKGHAAEIVIDKILDHASAIKTDIEVSFKHYAKDDPALKKVLTKILDDQAEDIKSLNKRINPAKLAISEDNLICFA